MRIVLDVYKDVSGRVLCLGKTLARCKDPVEILAAVSMDAAPSVPALRRRMEPWIPRQNIRVWQSPGPPEVTCLLHTACVAGLWPDVVVTDRPDRHPGQPCVSAEAIPSDAGPDRVLEILTARACRDGGAVHPGGVPLTLAVVSPLPPLHTGIADYTRALLPALARYYQVDVVVDQAGVADEWIQSHCGIRTPEWFLKNGGRYDRILYHVGNSAFHHYMLDLMAAHPGVVCLHDFFVGHFIRYADVRAPHTRAWDRALFHDRGYQAVQEHFHTLDPESMCLTYPCSFPLVENALGVLVHSRFAKNLARTWYPGLDTRFWEQIPMVRQPRHPGLPDPAPGSGTPFFVCSFGMLGPTKLNHCLVSAWLNSCLSRNPDCFLVFVGEKQQGTYCQDLEKTIRGSGAGARIWITGRVSPDDYAAWLGKAGLAVQLRTHSRGETSAAVLDCMNYGLPVIVNEHGANSELDSDAVWMLPDHFRQAELIAALDTLAQDPGRQERLGQRAAQTIAANHRPDTCAQACARAMETFYRRERSQPRHLVQALAAVASVSDDPGYLEDLACAIANNQPSPMAQKRVFIDVSATIRRDLKAGIDRVSRSLVLALIQDPPKGYRAEPVYLENETGSWHYRSAHRYIFGLMGCPPVWTRDSRVEMHPGDILFCPDLTGDILVAAEKTHLFDRIRQTGVTLVFTVFDLLPLQIPHRFPGGADKNFHCWLSAVCRIAHKVVCISKAVAQELSDWYETDPGFACLPMPAIDWFHLGADLASSFPTNGLPQNGRQVLDRINASLCFLMVGTLEPRKGHLQVLAAFDRLWAAGVDVHLVVVGRQGWTHLPESMRKTIPGIITALATHPEKDNRLFWLEGISDQFLEQVYDVSDCLIAASEAEGFGLPLIEAAQHGLPILARDIPVFREVAGDHAFYFQGNTPEDLADTIHTWLALHGQNRHPRSDAMPWLTWQQSCQHLVQCMTRDPGAPVFH
jgi:glycosyltransferase involved in cell wall biosynthesis